MAVNIAPGARQQFEAANGLPLVGAKLFTYVSGSTTKLATYTDSSGVTANTNPIILDASGRTPSGLWLTQSAIYTFVLALSTDTDPPTSPIWSEAGITGTNDTSLSAADQWVLYGSAPTFVSATSFTVVGDQTSTFHVGRRVRSQNTSGLIYSTITATVFGSVTTVTLVNDSGALDSGLTSVSVGLLTATSPSYPSTIAKLASPIFTGNVTAPLINLQAPYQVSKIFNGNFTVAQAGTTFTAPATGNYDADGWLQVHVGTAVYTIALVAGKTAYDTARRLTVTTAETAIAATDIVNQETRLEGVDCIPFASNSFTVGFWVNATVTGIHCFSVINGTSSYVSEYTINVTNTWEFKSITIPASPVLASSAFTQGLRFTWANMAGTNFHTTANAWNTGTFLATSAQVNDMATVGNTFLLQDVTLCLGSVACVDSLTFQERLSIAYRYYEKSFNYSVAPVQNLFSHIGAILTTTLYSGSVVQDFFPGAYFMSQKSQTPTITLYNPYAANALARNITQGISATVTTAENIAQTKFTVTYTPNSGALPTHQFAIHWSAESRL